MADDTLDGVEGFEVIKVRIKDTECWSARELMPLLGYEKWETFSNVIQKAQTACANSGQAVDKHFFPITGKNDGKGRPSEDFMLTRYACYLVAQNGSSRKPQVAFAQTYFAVQTLRQEEYDRLPDSDKRLYVRTQVKEGTKKLNSSAKQHGVRNYAYFHNAGYKGLYGMFLGDIRRRKSIGNDNLLDRAGTTELAANLFRITQTEERLHKDLDDGKRHGQQGAELVHYEIGSKVRHAIQEIGGTLPENLPAEENIKELEKRIKKDNKALLKPAEKPLKLTNSKGFEDTLGVIERHKPKNT